MAARNPKICAGKPPRLLPMGALQNRPCEVDGRPALFHRWVEEDQAIFCIDGLVSFDAREELRRSFLSDRVCPPGCHIEVLRETFALVEYPSGTVALVRPELLRFSGEEV